MPVHYRAAVSLSSPALSNPRLLGRLLLVAWHHRVRCVVVLGVQGVLRTRDTRLMVDLTTLTR